MLLWVFFCLIAVTAASEILVDSDAKNNLRFPDDFLFGVSTAAYQIEGAWNVDGRGPSIWDEFTHSHPERIKDRSTGDVAANSYEYFMDDIAAVKSLGMDYYRFSISWSRVLPNGDLSIVNEKGIEYYNNLINKLIELNIEPMVTMYHYDLPQRLQLFGGLTNPYIVRHFKAYANLLFERFGDRVKHWMTFNEPHAFCMQGYGDDFHAPGVNYSGVGDYLCGHNMLMAHAETYHLYKESYYNRFKGQVGITLNSFFYYSESNDTAVVDYNVQFMLGWFANPIFGSGEYPEVMVSRINENSENEGLSWSRLPTFSQKWSERIRGAADFLGLNYYTSRVVEMSKTPLGANPSYARDRNVVESVKPEWKHGLSEWLYSVPEGLGDLLRWIKREYNNPAVFITETGWSDKGELEDYGRIDYYRGHLQQVQKAVVEDGCNVKAFTAWSLIDNFEWATGYTEKFGLYYVNMTSPRRERVPKKSTEFMKTLTRTRQVPNM